MHSIIASWNVQDNSCSYNEWETLEPQSFQAAVYTALDMLDMPEDHECSGDDQEWDSEDFFMSSLNLHRGVFIIAEGSDAFSGADTGEWTLLKCHPSHVLARP